MEKAPLSDAALLADWLHQRREQSFHTLVARYAGLVLMAAKRTSADETIAAEASQLTFILLARKANSLVSHHSLAGWLHQTAVLQAKNLTRQNHRESLRRQSLQTSMEIESHSHPDESWKELQPVIDEALSSLSKNDREALLLRFYRSLSIREIAETLGIATDAAQKRIDRATQRLRSKLTRRGCRAGVSLSVTLLAGFTADAHAAVPVSILASKAIAASAAGTAAAGSFSLSTILSTTASLMKATTLIPPAIALVVITAWITHERNSISKLEEKKAALQLQLSDSSLADGNYSKRVSTSSTQRSKWEKLAADMAQWDKMGVYEQQKSSSFDRQVRAMSTEDLIAALDEIAALDLPADHKQPLEDKLIKALCDKDPAYALTHYVDRIDRLSREFPAAFSKWAKQDRVAATAWLDQQIAAGMFDPESLAGLNKFRTDFEAVLIVSLFATDRKTAEARLAALSPEQRNTILRKEQSLGEKEENQRAYADLIRANLPTREHGAVLAKLAASIVQRGGFAAVTQCLDRIQATPAERAASVQAVSFAKFSQISGTRKITVADINELAEWVDTQAPGTRDMNTVDILSRFTKRGGGIEGGSISTVIPTESRSNSTPPSTAVFTDEVVETTLPGPGSSTMVTVTGPNISFAGSLTVNGSSSFRNTPGITLSSDSSVSADAAPVIRTGSFFGAKNALSFSEAADLAATYHQQSGNDNVLVEFLADSNVASSGDPEERRALARKISDPVRREQILKQLD